MAITNQTSYKNLAKEIERSRQLEANLLIITFPGSGMGRLLTELAKQRPEIALTQDGSWETTKEMNILNYNWENPEILKTAEAEYQRLNNKQRIVVSMNFPHWLKQKEFKKSILFNHIYRKYYFGVRDDNEVEMMLKEMSVSKGVEKIVKQSGGIAQVVKYLATSGDDWREGIENVIRPIKEMIMKTDDEVLERLGLLKDGQWRGEILNGIMSQLGEKGDIKINFDLSFEENGQRAKTILTRREGEILRWMLAHEGQISKDEVAEIKWGEGQYDEFSDKAINKTMRRLGQKLGQHQIITIPKVGYQLTKSDRESR